MDFRWTSESAIAAVALVVSVVGGGGSLAMHYGVVKGDVATLQTQVDAHEVRLSAAQLAISNEAIQSAKVGQSLEDVKDSLNRIERNQNKLESEVLHVRPPH